MILIEIKMEARYLKKNSQTPQEKKNSCFPVKRDFNKSNSVPEIPLKLFYVWHKNKRDGRKRAVHQRLEFNYTTSILV